MATGYALLDVQNPNAPRRADGLRYWGYPSRAAEIQFISIHTAENIQDREGIDSGAENITRYFQTSTRPASYHEVGDSDSFIRLLPDEYTAFSVVGYNSRQWSWSFALRTIDWAADGVRESAMLRIGAARVGAACVRFGIPVRELTKREVDRGERGLVRHSTMDPSRRSDPGTQFKMGRFLQLVQATVDTLTTSEEEDMSARLVQDDEGRVYKVGGNTRTYINHPPTITWLEQNGHVPVGVQRIPTAVLRDAYPIEATDPEAEIA